MSNFGCRLRKFSLGGKPSVYKGGVSDGFYHGGMESLALQCLFEKGIYKQCDCSAHKQIMESGNPGTEPIIDLIRTPPLLNSVTGIDFALALLNIIFEKTGLQPFIVFRTGNVDGVSYTLLCEDKECEFRGEPDLFGAGRILVGSGEVQSARQVSADVGMLLNNFKEKFNYHPILCITIL